MAIVCGAKCAAVASALFLAGCAYNNNFPGAGQFIRPAIADCVAGRVENCVGDQVAHVFVDRDGTFYPSGWRGRTDLGVQGRGYSLLGATPQGSDARRFVEEQEARQLAEIAALGSGNGRIFILVHGFNNTPMEADAAYRMIERRLDLRAGDRVIRFYWDGLTGSGLGKGRIWFWAAGHSKFAGARGLRRVLNQFRGKEIFLLSHSRGASVVLSALADPLYSPRFFLESRGRAESLGLDAETFVHPEPLANGGNRIHVLAAAPAIGRIDFCDAAAQSENHDRYQCPQNRLRLLDAQVRSFRFTINRRDPALNKGVGLGHLFNPTTFGLLPEVSATLCPQFPLLRRYTVGPESIHLWTWYITQPGYAAMLHQAGILRRDPGSPEPEGGEVVC